MIDLHTHSTASDGTLTPAGLVARGIDLGLTAVALTDHDTTSGLPAFMAAAQGQPLEAVPGVEIASSWYGGSLHVVGLFIDPDHAPLQKMLDEIRQNRVVRNQQMLARLNELGFPLVWAEVAAGSDGEVVGRPHFAAALVACGYCRTGAEAFERLLGRNRPAYVRRYLPLPSETLRTIHAAGGVAVWAHPWGGISSARQNRQRQMVGHLLKQGLDGIETEYCDYSPEQRHAARQLANELALLHSGGSDYHGANLAGIELGCGYGNLTVPDEFLPPLKARAAAWKSKMAKGD